MSRIPKPKWTVLRLTKVAPLRNVRLLTSERLDGLRMYAVEYPHRVGGEDTGIPMQSQYMKKEEAEAFYMRMAEFYKSTTTRS